MGMNICANIFHSCDAVEGVLKGYDQLLNLVLDETVEYARGAPWLHATTCNKTVLFVVQRCTAATAAFKDANAHCAAATDNDDMLRITDETRPLGLVVRIGALLNERPSCTVDVPDRCV